MKIIDWINQQPGGKRTDLSVMSALLNNLGDPQKGLRFIHVTGTNGKGSVSAMLASVLSESGRRVGLYTSPHLCDVRERIRLCGDLISDGDFEKYGDLVKTAAEKVGVPFNFFELLTAIALCYYRDAAPDVILWEVGLGGRLDPTNVIASPEVSVVTNVDLDHTALLGNTVEAIAREKGGIIKAGRPVVYGGQSDEADRVLSGMAEAKRAPYLRTDPAACRVGSMTPDGTVLCYRDRRVTVPLLGYYQVLNAQTVLDTVDALNRYAAFGITEEQVTRGISKARWEARFERLGAAPDVFFDGGHNPNGIGVAVDTVRAFFGDRKILLLVGIMADKDHETMVSMLSRVAHRVYAVTPDSHRSLPATELAKEFRAVGADVTAIDSVDEALDRALSDAKIENLPLLCIGSLYLYPSVRDYFNRR